MYSPVNGPPLMDLQGRQELPNTGLVQQSAKASAWGSKFLQLSFPHTRSPLHSESLSQSPCPKVQGSDVVQKSQSYSPPVPFPTCIVEPVEPAIIADVDPIIGRELPVEVECVLHTPSIHSAHSSPTLSRIPGLQY